MDKIATVTKYLVRTFSSRVYKIEVARETAKCLFVLKQKAIGGPFVDRADAWDSEWAAPGSRIQKDGAYHDTFDTLSDAVDHIRKRLEKEIESLRKRRESVEENLFNFNEESTKLLHSVQSD